MASLKCSRTLSRHLIQHAPNRCASARGGEGAGRHGDTIQVGGCAEGSLRLPTPGPRSFVARGASVLSPSALERHARSHAMTLAEYGLLLARRDAARAAYAASTGQVVR
jgi:hypothetical protein